jgi:capsular polysaccharide biosynthesis protein
MAADYAQTHRLQCVEALPAQIHPRTVARWFGPTHALADLWYDTQLPPVQILSLPGGRLLWPESSVVSADDTLLTDTSFWALCDHGLLHRHPLSLRWRAPPQHRLVGRVLSLASDHAHHSFGHFLLDALPRLAYVQRAGYCLNDFNWIVLPHPPSATVDRLIAAAQLPRDRLINPRIREDFVCDELVCTTFPGRPGVYSPELPGFYRQLLGLENTRGRRRIYLSRQRQGRRRLANAIEIETVLARHGFETIYPESDPDIIQKCAEAAFIVGIEGSNFTNQVFSPPGGAVLLLIASNWSDLPYVYTVATAAGKNVFALNCDPVIDPADTRSHWTNPYDLIVDPALFDTALTAMLAT